MSIRDNLDLECGQIHVICLSLYYILHLPDFKYLQWFTSKPIRIPPMLS